MRIGREIKRAKSKPEPDPRPWNKRVSKTVPYRDENGNIPKDNPPLNREGFWVKAKDTSDTLRDQIVEKDEHREETEQ